MITLDLETYSETPIRSGVYAYSEKAEILLFAYAIDEQPVKVWDLTLTALMPLDLKAALRDPDQLIVGHNIGGFDRVLLKNTIGIDLDIVRVHDTMVRALTHSLPGSLGKLCEILQVPLDKTKDKRGHDLIQLLCKPLAANRKIRRATKETHLKEWNEFVEYATLDIEATREIYKRLPRWNYQGFEKRLWEIDQAINQRGIQIDIDLCKAALTAVERAQQINAELTSEATDGAVERATQRDRLLLYIKDTFGIVLKDLTASMVDKALSDDNLPSALRELLLLRSQASASSTAKYKKFLGAVSSDGRLRGMFQFCGASRTGRAAGRIVQLHNLPRPTMASQDIECGIRAIKAGGAHLLVPNVMELASNAIRGAIIAPPGKKLLVADLANIEGRICAWLANEIWKLKAFEAYDAGIGEDLYKVSYSRPFKVDVKSVTKFQRQIGKVMELMLQYAGGVGAFITGAATYRIDLENLASVGLAEIPPHIYMEAERAWEWAGKESRRYGLSKDVYIVCDALKRLWRNAHPNIVSLWAVVEDGVLLAHNTPGTSYRAGKITIRKDGVWLRIILPSGRALCYPALRIEDKKISYAGTNPYSRLWGRVQTYAGKLVENIVQAVARDVLMWGLVNAENNGYDIVAHVHDELIAEVPDTPEYTVDALIGFMTKNIPWTEGLPLAAAGHAMYRYAKVD